jgi:hypothetical protein
MAYDYTLWHKLFFNILIGIEWTFWPKSEMQPSERKVAYPSKTVSDWERLST